MDFSRNNHFLIYKETDEITVIDLAKLTKTNAIYTDLDIEWLAEGIQLTDSTKVNFNSFSHPKRELIHITGITIGS